jgi:DNA-binding protein H-NS
MKSNLDLSHLTVSQLLILQEHLPKELEKRRKAQVAEALRQIETIARNIGVPVGELMGQPVSGKKGQHPPRYADPHDAQRTWSGMGRKPAWIAELENQGFTLDQMKIKGGGNE